MKKSIILLFLSVFTLIAFGYVISNKQQEKWKENVVEKKTEGERQVGLNIGDVAPELKFKSPEGEEIALSSLRGKMVLIDFWASWCGPCRRENPHVVSAYEKYKDRQFHNGDGFTVYGVSLDKSKDRWVQAIDKDNLKWDYHVSDLGGWSSEPARIYGVRSIPSNFLIDADGVILAKGLRGANLHATLEQYARK